MTAYASPLTEPVVTRQWIEDRGADLPPQPPGAGGARVAHQPGRPVERLAERDAAERGVDEVVQRGVVGLAEILPGGAAEGGQRRRLVEVQAVGSPRIEVVAALVGMAELVDREVIQVPDPSLLHVGPPGLRRHTRRHLAAGQVSQAIEDVHHRQLEERASDTTARTTFAGAAFGVPGRGRLIAGSARRTPPLRQARG